MESDRKQPTPGLQPLPKEAIEEIDRILASMTLTKEPRDSDKEDESQPVDRVAKKLEYRFRVYGYRESYCWKCKRAINNDDYPECPACGWIICPYCGACSAFSCFGEIGRTQDERNRLRDEWYASHFSLSDFSYGVANQDEVKDWCLNQKTVWAEEEKKARLSMHDSLLKELAVPRLLHHPLHGYGISCGIIREGEVEKLLVEFQNPRTIKRFVFPDTFLRGMKFADDTSNKEE